MNIYIYINVQRRDHRFNPVPYGASHPCCAFVLLLCDSGLRTSEDLALASGKRAVPLLLAMADSPIGDADGALEGLVLDILHRVASLRRSGAR